jgi:hypothetical protein
MVIGDAGGSTNRMQMKITQPIATQPTSGLHRPRFQGPGWNSALRRRRNTGTTYAMYRPITAIEVTAR